MLKREAAQQITPENTLPSYSTQKVEEKAEKAPLSTTEEIQSRKIVVPLSPAKKKQSCAQSSLFKLTPCDQENALKSTPALSLTTESKASALDITTNASVFSGISNIFSFGSLFSNNSTNTKEADQPITAPDEEEEADEQDSIDKTLPLISAKEEDSPYIKIAKFGILKMKLGKRNLGSGTLSIERSKDKKTLLIVFRNSIGAVLYNGLVLSKISKAELCTDDTSKFNMSVLCIIKENGKAKKSVTKIRFNSKEDRATFYRKFQELCPEQSKVNLSQILSIKIEKEPVKQVYTPIEKKEVPKKEEKAKTQADKDKPQSVSQKK